MSRRPLTTKFGYTAPGNAEVVGWRCYEDGCHQGASEAPPHWPYLCENCRNPVDPVFAEPWAHDAKGYELRAQVASTSDDYMHRMASIDLCAWEFEEALRRGSHLAAVKAREDLARLAARLRAMATTRHLYAGRWKIIASALRHDVLDHAVDEVLDFYEDVRAIEKPDLEKNDPRTDVRTFVGACLLFLCDERSVRHPRRNEVAAVMIERHDFLREHQFSVGSLDEDRHRAMQLLAKVRGTARPRVPEWLPPADVPAPVDDRDLPGAVRERLKAATAVVAAAKRGQRLEELDGVLGGMARMVLAGNGTAVEISAAGVLADAALTVAEIHDDPAPLFASAEILGRSSALAHLLLARAHVVTGEISLAQKEVETALRCPDATRLGVLPHLHAMYGWLVVQLARDRIDAGIAACRTGRQFGRGRVTPADPVLARLLAEKALQRKTPAVEAVPLLDEALRLAKRAGAQAVAQEAKSALSALTGRGDVPKRLRAWRSAVKGAESAPAGARMRLAMAWVRWALGTGQTDLAAEAYHHVVSLLPALVRVRYRADAQARMLATVREHTEEAGYWLAKARRYRDAAVALETGRAVALSTLVERDDPVVRQALLDGGRGDLLQRYQAALTAVGSGDGHRAWAHFRAVAREVADVIGADPVEPVVEYADITQATGDGALVYVASAEAGGYALIVAAAHDPQCVWLPDLDRFYVEERLRSWPEDVKSCKTLLSDDLDWLWLRGMRELLAFFAHGSIITLIPVGVLALLPLHATAGRALHFPAIRYAPNARTLHWSRSRAAAIANRPARLLVADVPNAPGQSVLRFAPAESAAVAGNWPGQCTLLPEATWEAFEPAAHRHDVWHVVCHGWVDRQEVLRSLLAFTDREVTIADLRERFRFEPRRLAIVSACDLQNVGAEVPNEVVGLPSALLQLGFAGVIAASWPVSDQATAFLMARFHQVWRASGAHPAVALAAAQRWLRDAELADLSAVAPEIPLPPPAVDGPCPFAHPLYWAAFAYTGG
ncbi:CHAT domain-containing protein [Lentzea sp. NPDC005914]|uniref:CHAT domain-containing protein n=1 Tax=Lentzea sp. NPDC005914 TaxID=3154572 RepID=UPI0033C066DC